MVYSKLMRVCIALSIVFFLASSVIFATTDVEVKNDIVIGNIMDILIRIQKYSWPVAAVILLWALYQYFVIGSEAYEYKVNGQKMIMGIAIFMAIIQFAPLAYAFITVGI